MNDTNPARRSLLAATVWAPLAALPACAAFAASTTSAHESRFNLLPGAWRSFELTTRVEVADVQGTSKLWLPLPGISSDYQQTLGVEWAGNASLVRRVSDPARGVSMLYAEFAPGIAAPAISVTSRVRTRNRKADWADGTAHTPVHDDPAVLRAALRPTELLPLDGIVAATAQQATRGATQDIDKVRAIYDWVVANAHREPKIRGCGNGDIKAMLESGNLGGKCADLNAVFVGLCRASGIPARDLYGVRVARSAFGYQQLGANPAKLQGAQHCRAEVFLHTHGWVAMDPADVLKVMRQETPVWIRNAKDPLVAPVNAALFGGWEGNWVAYNSGNDVTLPGSAGSGTLPFLMYPNGENASGRFDELAPETFRYSISAREISG